MAQPTPKKEKEQRYAAILAGTIYLLSLIAAFVAAGLTIVFALNGNENGLQALSIFFPINAIVLLVSNFEARRRLKK